MNINANNNLKVLKIKKIIKHCVTEPNINYKNNMKEEMFPKIVHYSFKQNCIGCGKDIIDTMYNCSVCYGLNICENCYFNSFKNHGHNFVKKKFKFKPSNEQFQQNQQIFNNNVYRNKLQQHPPMQYGLKPAYTQLNQRRTISDFEHEHSLSYEPCHDTCKFCHKTISNNAYLCHQCPLVLCNDCANDILHGNKAKHLHIHALPIIVRYSWKCDICKQCFRETASFCCKPCDFDACKRCYIGF